MYYEKKCKEIALRKKAISNVAGKITGGLDKIASASILTCNNRTV